MNDVTFLLNGAQVSAPAGATILEAARLNGVEIPTLCYLKELHRTAACRMCVVEVKGARLPVVACVTPVGEGMEIVTDSPQIRAARKENLERLAENHRLDCEYCPNYQGCELHALFVQYGVNTRKHGAFSKQPVYDETAAHLGLDSSRCILCRRCVGVCEKQDVRAIAVQGRGADARVAAPEGLGLSACIGCGQCAAVCPTGSIFVKDDTHKVWVALNQGKRPVVAVVDPAVGVALGERFHEELGGNAAGKLVAFLKRVGVRRVYSTQGVGEARRLRAVQMRNGEGKTALSGDCQAFVRYVERFYPDLKEDLVEAPAPEIAAARLARSAYGAEAGVDPAQILVVSLSPCTAQKLTRLRPEYAGEIDAAVTTVELYEMLRRACLSRYTTLDVWKKLKPAAFDPLSGDGGGSVLPDAVPGDVSGAVSETRVTVDGAALRVKTVSGLGSARGLLDQVRQGTADCEYLVVRACPGGCVNGGGQPKLSGATRNFTDYAAARAAALKSCFS
jgi:NADP-reducing hydrogenase subunit HndD